MAKWQDSSGDYCPFCLETIACETRAERIGTDRGARILGMMNGGL